MMLAVDVEKSFPALTVRARFESTASGTALFGPSGAGKTTIINMIAGLVKPDRGRLALGDDVLFDSKLAIDVPVHRRNIGYVFQEGRLFPHLTVAQNLRYGRWMRGLKRASQDEERIIGLLDLGSLLARRPGRLSGGERQRVAIGRALLMQPRLLLLDEPLASLDAARKADILPYLERLRDEAGVPLVYVSHQPDEIRHVARAVVRVEHGDTIAIGGLELLDLARSPGSQ